MFDHFQEVIRVVVVGRTICLCVLIVWGIELFNVIESNYFNKSVDCFSNRIEGCRLLFWFYHPKNHRIGAGSFLSDLRFFWSKCHFPFFGVNDTLFISNSFVFNIFCLKIVVFYKLITIEPSDKLSLFSLSLAILFLNFSMGDSTIFSSRVLSLMYLILPLSKSW